MSCGLYYAEAYLLLVHHEVFTRQHTFGDLHRAITTYAVRSRLTGLNTVDHVTHAVEVACAFYPKQVLCLQRSAVLVKMLRNRGIPAHMMIGAQKLPFKAHAWVEVDGKIINDRLASRENFYVLEVC